MTKLKNLTLNSSHNYLDDQEFRTSILTAMATTQPLNKGTSVPKSIFFYARSAENKIEISNNPSRSVNRRSKLLAPSFLVCFTILEQQLTGGHND